MQDVLDTYVAPFQVGTGLLKEVTQARGRTLFLMISAQVLYSHLRQEWKLCANPWVFSIFKYILDQEMPLITSHITQTGNQHDKLERQRLLESNHKALDP